MKLLKKTMAVFLCLLTLTGIFMPAQITADALGSNDLKKLAAAVEDFLPVVTYATPASGSSKIYPYTSKTSSSKYSKYWISCFSEQIVIRQFSSDGKRVYVAFPLDNGSYKSLWFSTEDIFGLNAVKVQELFSQGKTQVLRAKSATKTTNYGSVTDWDCRSIGTLKFNGSTYYKVFYKLSSSVKVNGVTCKYKMGIITSSSYKKLAAGLSISPISVTLNGKGSTYTFKATINPKTCTAGITWTSSKPEIATVNKNGVVTAKSEGKTTITATITGSDIRCTATVTVKGSDSSSSGNTGGNTSNSSTELIWPVDMDWNTVTCVYYYKDGRKHGCCLGNSSSNSKVSSALGGNVLKNDYLFGIDISTADKNKVYAVADGTVVYASDTTYLDSGIGYCVIIKHKNGHYSLYGHLYSVNVKAGDKVKQGTQIALTGSSGSNGGKHLHFEYSGDAWLNYKDKYIENLIYDDNVVNNNNAYNSNKYIVTFILRNYTLKNDGYYHYNSGTKYLDSCTLFSENHFTITIKKDCTINSLPRNESEKNNSFVLNYAKAGEKYNVVNTYVNTAGNIWYEVESNGTTGFIYSGNVK